MTSQDLSYYRQRAYEELAAAERAGDPAIAQIHHAMAQRYREFVMGRAVSNDKLPGLAANGAARLSCD